MVAVLGIIAVAYKIGIFWASERWIFHRVFISHHLGLGKHWTLGASAKERRRERESGRKAREEGGGQIIHLPTLIVCLGNSVHPRMESDWCGRSLGRAQIDTCQSIGYFCVAIPHARIILISKVRTNGEITKFPMPLSKKLGWGCCVNYAPSKTKPFYGAWGYFSKSLIFQLLVLVVLSFVHCKIILP